jgi:hypothetical protein
MLRRRILATALALALALPGLLASTAAPATARDSILLVGNSFTAGIKSRLRMLARSAGRDVAIGVCAGDGFTLAHHAASRSSLAKIHSRDWQTVVLQEQSKGIDIERYPAARVLDAEIAGRTVFFMTWRDRGALLADYDTLRGQPGGDTGYVPIAFELGAAVAPVGWAFRELLVEDALTDLWGRDAHHANDRGRYLAALVLYAAIFGESPVGLWMHPALPEEQAYHDQLLVERLVFDDPAQWNIALPDAPGE